MSGAPAVRVLEAELRRRFKLSRRQAQIVISRGRRWRWLARLNVALFAWVVVWRM